MTTDKANETKIKCEAYVRENWKEVVVSGPNWPNGGRPAIGVAPIGKIAEGSSWERAWIAAAEFTRERIAQILEVEEEISYVKCFFTLPVQRHPVWARICAREEATLAELRKGMQEKGAGR